MLPTEESNSEIFSHSSSYDEDNCSLIKSTKPKRVTFSHGSSYDGDNCSLIESTKPKRVTLTGSAISAFEDKIQTNKKQGISNLPQIVRDSVADEDAPSFQVPRENVRRRAPIRRSLKRIRSSMLLAGKITLNTKDEAPTRTNSMKMERRGSRRLQRRRSSKLKGLKRAVFNSHKNETPPGSSDTLSTCKDLSENGLRNDDNIEQTEDSIESTKIKILSIEESNSDIFSHSSSYDEDNCSLIKSTKPKNVTLTGSAISAFEDKIQTNKKQGMSNIPQIVRDAVADEDAPSFQVPRENVRRRAPIRRSLNRIRSSMLLAGKITLNTEDEAPTRTNSMKMERRGSRRLQRRRSSKLKGLKSAVFKSHKKCQDQNSIVEDKLNQSEDSVGVNINAYDESPNQGNNELNVDVKTPPGSSDALSMCKELCENSLRNDDNIEQTEDSIRAYLTKYGRRLSRKNLANANNMEQKGGPIESSMSKDERIRSYLSKYGKKLSRKSFNFKACDGSLNQGNDAFSAEVKTPPGTNMEQKGGPIESSMSRDERIRAFLSKYGNTLSKKCLTDTDNKETRDSIESASIKVEQICQNKDVLVNEDPCDVDTQEEEVIDDSTNEFTAEVDLKKEDYIEPGLTQEDPITEIDSEKKLPIEPDLVMKGDFIEIKTEQICQIKDVPVNDDPCDVDMQEEELIETDLTNEFTAEVDLMKEDQIEPGLTQVDPIIEIGSEKKLPIEPNLAVKGDLIEIKTEQICQNTDVAVNDLPVNDDPCDVDMQEEELIETDLTNESPVGVDLMKEDQIEPSLTEKDPIIDSERKLRIELNLVMKGIEPGLTQEDPAIEIDSEKKLRIELNLVMKGDLIEVKAAQICQNNDVLLNEDKIKPKKKKMKKKGSKTKKSKRTTDEKESNKKQIKSRKRNCVKKGTGTGTDSSIIKGKDSTKNTKTELRNKTKQ